MKREEWPGKEPLRLRSGVWTIGSRLLPKVFEENIVTKGVFRNEIFSVVPANIPKAGMALSMFV